MNNKILILILSTKDSRYNNFINNCTNTWVANARKNGIKCIFYSGGATEDKLHNDHLELACDDSLSGTAFKLYRALKYIENCNIDYTHIYRTNLSSYLFINDFIKYSNSINDTFYGGVIGTYNKITLFNRFHFISVLSSKFLKFQTLQYASGSGFFISKNLVKIVIQNKNLNFKYIDDVMIGDALRGQNITFISRFDISNYIEKLPYEDGCYHIRLKSNDRTIDAERLLLLNNYSNLNLFIASES